MKLYCESIGIEYSTSVWDSNSARATSQLNPRFIKVPSACNNNYELLEVLRDEYIGDIQISFGMKTHQDERAVIKFFYYNYLAKQRLIIFACTSGYPVPFENAALLEIKRLYDEYGDRVKEIGFSGHHLGIAVDIAAYTLGAKWIERHFTKDSTWKGPDHAASLEPAGLKKLIRA